MIAEIATAIRLAQQGDRKAFRQIYEAHIGRVYSICLRLLGNSQRAEDACQEIFVKLWQQLPGFRGDSEFGTWLHTIATRTAIDVWRRERRHNLHVVSENAMGGAEAVAAVAEGNTAVEFEAGEAVDSNPAEAGVLSESLEAAIQQLPNQARMVFVLFAIEGCTHREIAGILGIAEGSSKAQYHRARQILREKLSDH